jgi:hypothetical protein
MVEITRIHYTLNICALHLLRKAIEIFWKRFSKQKTVIPFSREYSRPFPRFSVLVFLWGNSSQDWFWRKKLTFCNTVLFLRKGGKSIVKKVFNFIDIDKTKIKNFSFGRKTVFLNMIYKSESVFFEFLIETVILTALIPLSNDEK